MIIYKSLFTLGTPAITDIKAAGAINMAGLQESVVCEVIVKVFKQKII